MYLGKWPALSAPIKKRVLLQACRDFNYKPHHLWEHLTRREMNLCVNQAAEATGCSHTWAGVAGTRSKMDGAGLGVYTVTTPEGKKGRFSYDPRNGTVVEKSNGAELLPFRKALRQQIEDFTLESTQEQPTLRLRLGTVLMEQIFVAPFCKAKEFGTGRWILSQEGAGLMRALKFLERATFPITESLHLRGDDPRLPALVEESLRFSQQTTGATSVSRARANYVHSQVLETGFSDEN